MGVRRPSNGHVSPLVNGSMSSNGPVPSSSSASPPINGYQIPNGHFPNYEPERHSYSSSDSSEHSPTGYFSRGFDVITYKTDDFYVREASSSSKGRPLPTPISTNVGTPPSPASALTRRDHIPAHTHERSRSTSMDEEFDYDSWTLDKVLKWLEDNSFGEFRQTFLEKGICGREFIGLSSFKKMKELQKSTSERNRLINAIRKIGEKPKRGSISDRGIPNLSCSPPAEYLPSPSSANSSLIGQTSPTTPINSIPSPTGKVPEINPRISSINWKSNANNTSHSRKTDDTVASPRSPISKEVDNVRKPPKKSHSYPSVVKLLEGDEENNKNMEESPRVEILATCDHSVFRVIDVTGIGDPFEIKKKIFDQLNIDGEREKYALYLTGTNKKEIGPLIDDEELIKKCKSVDDRDTIKFFIERVQSQKMSYTSIVDTSPNKIQHSTNKENKPFSHSVPELGRTSFNQQAHDQRNTSLQSNLPFPGGFDPALRTQVAILSGIPGENTPVHEEPKDWRNITFPIPQHYEHSQKISTNTPPKSSGNGNRGLVSMKHLQDRKSQEPFHQPYTLNKGDRRNPGDGKANYPNAVPEYQHTQPKPPRSHPHSLQPGRPNSGHQHSSQSHNLKQSMNHSKSTPFFVQSTSLESHKQYSISKDNQLTEFKTGAVNALGSVDDDNNDRDNDGDDDDDDDDDDGDDDDDDEKEASLEEPNLWEKITIPDVKDAQEEESDDDLFKVPPKPTKALVEQKSGEESEILSTKASNGFTLFPIIKDKNREIRSIMLKTTLNSKSVNPPKKIGFVEPAENPQPNELEILTAPQENPQPNEPEVFTASQELKNLEDLKTQVDGGVEGPFQSNSISDSPDQPRNPKLARSVSRRRGVIESWVVRPSAEDVLENLAEYFPGHDVDKEILEAHGTIVNPPSSSTGNRKLNRGKSIRLAAEQLVERERGNKMVTAAKAIQATYKLRRKPTKIGANRTKQIRPEHSLHITQNSQGSYEGNSGEAVSKFNQEKEVAKIAWVKGELLGKGTFGKVYLGINMSTSEMIAVKQIELPKTRSDLFSDRQEKLVKSFYDERHLLEELEHEHIVQYLGYERTVDVLNIFLEYVTGGSIGTCLRINGKFKESVVRSFTRQILLGLEYLHEKFIVHRDIKADNILVSEEGCCKISDFGISKKNEQALAYVNMSNMSFQGTIFWMAPEVFTNTEGYSAKVDIWSLGCVVIEMFTGNRPWADFHELAAMYKLGSEKKAPPIPNESQISPEAKDFLENCFIIDPEQRPTAKQLLNHKFAEEDPNFHLEKYIKVPQIVPSKSTQNESPS